MKKFIITSIVVLAAMVVGALAQGIADNNEKQRLKADVRLLLDDIERYGDIDTYTGSDHFERLYWECEREYKTKK